VTSADAPGQPPAPPRPRVPLLVGIAALVLAADVVTKVLAVARLEDRDPVELLGGAVYLVLVRNPGAAFSLATGYTWVLSLIALGVVVVIIRVSRNLRSTGWAVAVAVVVVIARIARRLRSAGWAVALGLVLGGALGNLMDRIFRAPGPLQGHVVDVVSLFAPDGSVWPVFNLADSSIVTGGVLLVLLALTGRELDGTRVARQHAAKGGAAKSMQPHDAVPQEPPQPGPVGADETAQGTTQRTDRG
jgi:signal peptidase II